MSKKSHFLNLNLPVLNVLKFMLLTLGFYSFLAKAGSPPLPSSLSAAAAHCTAKYMVLNQMGQQFGQKSNDGILDRILATAALSVVTGGEKQFFTVFEQEQINLKPYLEVFNQTPIDSKKGFENIKVLGDSVQPCFDLDKEIQTQQPIIINFLTSPTGVNFQKKLAQAMP